MFANREQAAMRLSEALRPLELRNPLVLAIPRGGVVTGAVLARQLGAELDVVLARKLGAPSQPELAVGAVGEDGQVYLNRRVAEAVGADDDYIQAEQQRQMGEIARRQKLFRAARPQASVRGRSVILTDDGIATGSTMLAALHVIQGQQPHEVTVAVPVGSPDRLEPIRRLCNRLICLLAPPDFYAVGQFYQDFRPVEDEAVVELLAEFARVPPGRSGDVRTTPLIG